MWNRLVARCGDSGDTEQPGKPSYVRSSNYPAECDSCDYRSTKAETCVLIEKSSLTCYGSNNDDIALLTPTRTIAAFGRITRDFGIAQAINNPSLIKIIGTHLHLNRIACCDFDEMLP